MSGRSWKNSKDCIHFHARELKPLLYGRSEPPRVDHLTWWAVAQTPARKRVSMSFGRCFLKLSEETQRSFGVPLPELQRLNPRAVRRREAANADFPHMSVELDGARGFSDFAQRVGL